jgi:hypothetical protein
VEEAAVLNMAQELFLQTAELLAGMELEATRHLIQREVDHEMDLDPLVMAVLAEQILAVAVAAMEFLFILEVLEEAAL